VDASDIGNVHKGQRVLVKSDSIPKKEWEATVENIASTVTMDEGSNNILVSILLNDKKFPFRLDEQLDVKIITESKKSVRKLLLDAIIRGDDGKSRVAIIHDGKIKYVPVVVGIEDFTHVEIKQGVEVGEHVVVIRGKELDEGTRIKLFDSNVKERL
jgi:HlyD family secretion protein